MIDAQERDAYGSYQFPVLPVGARVRLRAPTWGLRLRSDLGTVIQPTEDDGYYVIRLDAPALYDHGGAAPEMLLEVVEASDNVDVLDQAVPTKVTVPLSDEVSLTVGYSRRAGGPYVALTHDGVTQLVHPDTIKSAASAIGTWISRAARRLREFDASLRRQR